VTPRQIDGVRWGKTDLGRVEIRADLAFDGLLRYAVTIEPDTDVTVDELVLDVPLANDQARLGHYNRASWLSDSAFAIGQEPGWRWVREFQPCIWIGNERAGLTWYAQSPKGWRPADPEKAISLCREDDATHLRLHFIGKRTTLVAPCCFHFALQPTPVKPFPPPSLYRHWHIAHWKGGSSSGSEHDYLMDIEGAKRMGVKAVCIHSYWADFFSSPRPYAKKRFKAFVERCHAADIKVLPYFSLTGLAAESPEYRQYGQEWALIPGWSWAHGRRFTRPSQYANSVCTASSWADYISDGIQRLAEEYDIDGVYLDNSGMYPCCNPLHGCGYPKEEEQLVERSGRSTAYETWGEAPEDRTPIYPIWAVRDLHERIYVIFKSLNKETIISRHTSGSCVPAFFSFVDTFWTGEQYVHSKPGTALPLVKFRTEFIGSQWGLPAEYLLNDGHPFTIEQGLSLALPHDTLIRPYLPPSGRVTGEERPLRILSKIWQIYDNFRIEEAAFLPYWDPPPLAPEAPDPVKVSAHFVKARRALIIVSNLQGSSCDCDFELILTPLGLDGQSVTWRDGYTGTPLEMAEGRVKTTLDAMAHKLFLVKRER